MSKKAAANVEWEREFYEIIETTKKLKKQIYNFQTVAKVKLDDLCNEIEDIPYDVPKLKTRDKAEKTEEDLYTINEKVDEVSGLCEDVARGMADIDQRVKLYLLTEKIDEGK